MCKIFGNNNFQKGSGTLICKKCEEKQFAKDFSGICKKCLEPQNTEFAKETTLEQQIAKNKFSGTTNCKT